METLIGAGIMLVGILIGALLTVATYKTLSMYSEVEKPRIEALQGLVSQGAISPNTARDFMGYDEAEGTSVPTPIDLPRRPAPEKW